MNVAFLTVFSRVFLGFSSSLLPWQSHMSSRLVAVSPLLSSQSASVSFHLQNFPDSQREATREPGLFLGSSMIAMNILGLL